jgi:hypothetical protein
MPRDEKFPRSDSLPAQSPLFWVEQKDRYLRQLLIRDIEEHSGRRLVVYFANRYENAQIEPRDSTFIAELLGDINNESFDLLLETGGGMTDATESKPDMAKAWLLYCMYDHDCRKDRLLKVFEGRARSTAIAIPPPMPVPPK